MTDDFSRQLEAPAAERWQHEPNPLVGVLISRYQFDGGQYEPATMLVIQSEGADTAFSVLCGRQTLRSFVDDKDPQIGGRVGLRYRGERTSAAGNTYADYSTAYQPPEPQQEQQRNIQREDGEKTDVPF
jgi:hypothetical protein